MLLREAAAPTRGLCVFDTRAYADFKRETISPPRQSWRATPGPYVLMLCAVGEAPQFSKRTYRFRRHETSQLFDRMEGMQRAAEVDLEALLLGRSWAMEAIRNQVRAIAPFRDISVMVLGESGTGKDLVARALHAVGSPDPERFIAVNCAAVPEPLFESTVFGHAQGAYTGAEETRPGLLERANGGTIFLDEVADIPLGVQAKLLRVLEQRSFRRVGANIEMKFDAGVICATSRDVRDESGFRGDLYHRLAGFTIAIPPLRRRPEDVLDLAPAFLRAFCLRHRLGAYALDPEALEVFQRYRWPGNVRELKTVVEQLTITASNRRIEKAAVTEVLSQRAGGFLDPSENAGGDGPGKDLLQGRGLREYGWELTLATLERNAGNVAQTARELGVPRSTLRDRLRRWGLEGA